MLKEISELLRLQAIPNGEDLRFLRELCKKENDALWVAMTAFNYGKLNAKMTTF